MVNAGITLDEKVVAIKSIKDYSCNQEEVLAYSPLQKVECSTQLEMKAFDKEELAKESVGEADGV